MLCEQSQERTQTPAFSTRFEILRAIETLMSRIHPRMPVILHVRDYDRWLDREETERLPLDLLRPYESEENGRL